MRRGGWTHAWARRRRAVALVACAVWLIGLELGPNLHLALHDQLGAHDHGARPKPRFRVEATPRRDNVAHRHGDVVHRHDREEPGTRETPERPPAPERDHAGGLAHRDDLFAPAPFVLILPAPVDPPGVVIELPAPPAAAWRPTVPAAARGPPATLTPV